MINYGVSQSDGLMDDGLITICTLKNTAEDGMMPVEKLQEEFSEYFEEKSIGVTRQYAAKGVNEKIDLLVRIWRAPVSIGQYAIISEYELQENEEGDQYRIDNVSNTYNYAGLKVTDVTLSKLEGEYYDVIRSET